MTITNGYCTLEQLKVRTGALESAKLDGVLEECITAASRAIDNYTGRRFYADSAATTKYYTTSYFDTLYLNDDIVSIGTLSTDNDGDRTYENVWETTDYDLLPYNGAPYTRIETAPQGDYSFPNGRKAVKIEGIFGISAVPAEVQEACLLIASRLFKRKDTPFGVAGVTDLGVVQMLPEDRDVKSLLAYWRRLM